MLLKKEIMVEKKNYRAIDGLRAYSAIGIVLMHVLQNGGYDLEGFLFERVILSFADLVFLFMIISGFGMCCGYYEQVISKNFDIRTFYGKRYFRVWPCFAVFCILDLMIAPSKNACYEVFANLTLCFGLLPNARLSVIGVGYFLGVLFVFYLLFPYFCYLLSSKRRAWVSFGCALVFNRLCTIYFNAGRSNFVYCAVFFLVGGIIFLYKGQLTEIAQKHHWMIWFLCIGVTAIYYSVRANVYVLVVLFCAMLVYAIGVQKNGILQNKVTKFLSEISMEIYLAHMVVYRVLEKMKLIHLFTSELISYVVTAIGTLIGVVVFAVILKYALQKVNEIGHCLPDICSKVRNKEWLKRN